MERVEPSPQAAAERSGISSDAMRHARRKREKDDIRLRGRERESDSFIRRSSGRGAVRAGALEVDAWTGRLSPCR